MSEQQNLWLKAIKQNDIQLAVDTAKFLGDRPKLQALIFDSWQKKEMIAFENVCKALGFTLTADGCEIIEKALAQANKKRRNGILQMQDILKLLIKVCEEQCTIEYIKGYSTYKETFCLVVRMKSSLALGIKHAQGQYCSPADAWPDYFSNWSYLESEMREACEKWAHEASDLYIELTTPIPMKKNEPGLVEQALSAIQKSWFKFTRLLSSWGIESITLTKEEIAKIEEECKRWEDKERDVHRFLETNKLQWLFIRTLYTPYKGRDKEEFIELVNSTAVENITYIAFNENEDKEIMRACLHSPYLKNLRSLHFRDHYFSREAITSPYVDNIEEICLDYPYEGIDSKTIFLFETYSRLKKVQVNKINASIGTVLGKIKNLEELCCGYKFLDGGCRAFLANIAANTLRVLDILYIDQQELIELLSSSKLQKLETLRFRGNINKEVGKALSDSAHLANLKCLKINGPYGSCAPEVIVALAKNPCLKNITHLEINLFKPQITPQMIKTFANSPNIENLEVLMLHNCSLDDKSFSALVTSPYLKKLKELRLSRSCITNKGIQALYKTTLVSLKILELAYCSDMKKAGELLANWSDLARLEYLNVKDSLDKENRAILTSSKYLNAIVEGLPEYENKSNWQSIKRTIDAVGDTIAILGKRKKIVKEVEKQILLWAKKFEIELIVTAKNPGISVDAEEINRSQKELSESQISDTVYAVALIEEAKRQIANKHQEHITKVYNAKIKLT